MSAAEEARKVLEGSSYRLKLLASKSITLQLVFTARVEATYDFPLLIQLMGYGFTDKGLLCMQMLLVGSKPLTFGFRPLQWLYSLMIQYHIAPSRGVVQHMCTASTQTSAQYAPTCSTQHHSLLHLPAHCTLPKLRSLTL